MEQNKKIINLNMLLMVFCTILYAIHTCLLRYFKKAYENPIPSDLIVCYQYVISVIILLPLIIIRFSNTKKISINQKLIPQFLLRCLMIFSSTISWYYALSCVPAVNCIAISCLTPIFILMFAKMSLGEQLPKGIVGLAIMAMAGACIILSPDPSGFNSGTIFALFAAFLWAINSVFTKKNLSPHFSSITIFFMTAIVLSIMAIPHILMTEHSVSFEQLFFLAIITIVFDMANILLIWVFSRGKVSLIAPFDFLRVVFTTVFAATFLGESVSDTASLGIVVILSANALSTLYTNRTKKIQQTQSA